MAFDREAAKQAGYTDAEIDAYLQNKPEMKEVAPVAPGQEGEVGEPPAPTTVVNEVEPSLASAATTAAIGVAPYVAPAVGAAAVGVGGSKLYNAWDASAKAAQALADAKMASEQGIAQRAAAKQGMAPAARPSVYATPTYNQPVANMPATPVAPQAPMSAPVAQAAPQAETGVINSARSIVQKLALDKVLKGAGIAAGAYEMGKGLFSTSPEEIEIMRQAEARKRAQGWKPLNER